MNYDYDLFIIGAGPGGLAAAKRAAKYGAKVAIAEQHQVGGVCVNRGCIPKKLMVYAADFAQWLEDASGYGWTIGQPQFDWQRFVAARNHEVEQIVQSHRQALEKAGVDIIPSHAALVDAHTLDVGDRKVTADKVLIAVGGKPIKPKIPGIEHTITSKEIFDITALPKRLAIIGSGYIGVEFASMMRGFDVDVILMDRSPSILTGFDEDVCQQVQNGLIERGIQSFCNTTAKHIEKNADGIQLQLDGDYTQTMTVDLVLCAIGRQGNLENLGLEQLGVEMDKGAIAVDEHSRTNIDNIYAVGDCTARLPLTPVATAEGRAFAETVFGNSSNSLDYEHVPSAVFARPEAAGVGMTEAKAREVFGDAVRCFKTEFKPLFSRLSQHPIQSMMKLVVDGESDRVVGAHIVGEHAAEMIQGLSAAIRQGITKTMIDSTVGIHPTSAEELFVIE